MVLYLTLIIITLQSVIGLRVLLMVKDVEDNFYKKKIILQQQENKIKTLIKWQDFYLEVIKEILYAYIFYMQDLQTYLGFVLTIFSAALQVYSGIKEC